MVGICLSPLRASAFPAQLSVVPEVIMHEVMEAKKQFPWFFPEKFSFHPLSFLDVHLAPLWSQNPENESAEGRARFSKCGSWIAMIKTALNTSEQLKNIYFPSCLEFNLEFP